MPPSISVIVAAHNAATTLGSTLASVVPQLGPADEVIVIDDGSTDDTAAVAAGAGVRLVRFDVHEGLGAAHHAGEDAAQGDVIAYLDADDVAEPGYIEALRAAFDAGAAAVACALLPDLRPGRIVRHGVQVSGDHDLGARNGFLPAWTGAAAAVRADVLAVVGGSDPALRLAADTDLAFRLGLASVRIDPVPAAGVRYQQRTTLAGYLRSRYRRGVWEQMLAWKWQDFAFVDVCARAGRRRAGRELARAAGLVFAGAPGAAVDSLLDAVAVAALRAGRAAGWLDLYFLQRTPPPAPLPAPAGRELLAAPLAGPPPFVIGAPDRRVAEALAAALRSHPSLGVPPPGLAGAIGDRWPEPAPWARRTVRWANASGWRLHEHVAARRLEDERPATVADAYRVLHGVSAWLMGKERWAVVEVGEDAARAATALGLTVRAGTLADAAALATELSGAPAPSVAAAVPLAAVLARVTARRRPVVAR